MTHFERLTRGTPEEMAFSMFALLLPFLDDYTEGEKNEIHTEILEQLKREV